MTDPAGGVMAYRCAKAAVNMAAVTMSVDLKPKNIAVGLVHPGMLKTSFGGGTPPGKMAKMFKPVEGGAEGVVQALDALNMETTVRMDDGEGCVMRDLLFMQMPEHPVRIIYNRNPNTTQHNTTQRNTYRLVAVTELLVLFYFFPDNVCVFTRCTGKCYSSALAAGIVFFHFVFDDTSRGASCTATTAKGSNPARGER